MSSTMTIPRMAARPSTAGKRTKFVIGSAIIFAVIAYLVVNAVQTTGAYYLEVHEIRGKEAALTGKQLRVSGEIVQETVRWDAPNLSLSFSIRDQTGTGDLLPVHFHGVMPDNFTRPGSTTILEGKLREDGVFEAKTLLLKCPSRYEEAPQEVTAQAIE
ncbi:MAG: cytochrome c maturation protein CcmE [Anaerolineae bacterium]|nr:cytochrome c maturation protein CcmE [Anaerolineae bacterium]MDW8098838.1 cytochrome c maturation protein CcmE [Anaerolineae bacterium]